MLQSPQRIRRRPSPESCPGDCTLYPGDKEQLSPLPRGQGAVPTLKGADQRARLLEEALKSKRAWGGEGRGGFHTY